ncbi:protein-glutamate O-methyltransferase CheR [Desulfococcaceae bacterium HSG8]|nr:protein-glutamate O-methyltransferase CheR [Desulfococcaceae bacterium HSG8]
MDMLLKITEPEYILMKTYIEEHCGIHLEKDKEYLIESRLHDLLTETGCRSFQEFHFKARTDRTGELRDRIVDAMTTNETSWFRDKNAWEYLKEMAVTMLLNQVLEIGKANVWSAAVSTGQEAYSLIMLLDEAAKERGLPSLSEKVEIFATDISSSALAVAASARYDSIAMNRGLPDDKKEKYFTKEDNSWLFDQELKKRVRFKKFNLQNSFVFPDKFDMILCRYVTIYFSDTFKREVFKKMSDMLRPGGILLLGATESLREFSDDFEISYYRSVVVNTKK